jgi:hypothetical protein
MKEMAHKRHHRLIRGSRVSPEATLCLTKIYSARHNATLDSTSCEDKTAWLRYAAIIGDEPPPPGPGPPPWIQSFAGCRRRCATSRAEKSSAYRHTEIHRAGCLGQTLRRRTPAGEGEVPAAAGNAQALGALWRRRGEEEQGRWGWATGFRVPPTRRRPRGEGE